MATSLAFTGAAASAFNSPDKIVPTAGVIKTPCNHGRELFLNHLWESLNAAAKILFFAVATPMMLAHWGRERFGLFAVANSCVALMAFVDLGLRTLTRVGLTNPKLPPATKLRLHALNVVAFSAAAGVTLVIVTLLALSGYWHRWLNLSPAGDFVIAVTAVLTAATMALQLLLERIAAAGHLSRIKAALFGGNVLAFVIAIVLLRSGTSVAGVAAGYFSALGFPLLLLLPTAHVQWRDFGRAVATLRAREILIAITSGGWINLITASWIFQSYGLVLLISSVLGAASAGTFFLFLKLAELLGVLGASASEPTIAALAGATTAQDRQRHFALGYKSALALCLSGAAVYSFFCDDLFRIWLHRSLDYLYTGLLIGLFGVATGFIRMINAATLGLTKPRSSAVGLFFGAIVLTGAITVFKCNIESILIVGCAVSAFMLPSAKVIARDLNANVVEVWVRPLIQFIPTLAIIISISWGATRFQNLLATVVAIFLSALLCAAYILYPVPKKRDSIFEYDTRSMHSALVMKAIDLLNPFRRSEQFSWKGPCVVSSTAGLGDLFIHLPLIAGIVKEANRRQIDIAIALRPAHLVIGNLCGWCTLPFDNALEDFFKNPKSVKISELFRRIRQTRLHTINLWIDLTGSAISALAIKLAGACKIASRITRGGRSLVNHRLPHLLHENEYGNVERVAAQLGCRPDYSVFEKLRGEPIAGLAHTVVLCLTTICRWRNWPLKNFLALVDRFPEIRFVATGFRAELSEEDRPAFEALLQRPNVIPQIDELSIVQLIRLIAHSRAVVTNDTSTAHIANAFGKPGAVLFGPASPDKLASSNGLKPFGDQTCPHHPCVQWKCSNQQNWCMRKISVDAIAAHLSGICAAHAATRRLKVAAAPSHAW
jgi:ADP-heptose:LPS heptosyltransferase